MAAGEHGHGELARVDPEDLPTGAVVTESGRVSAAEIYRDPSPSDHPFTPVQLTRLDEALTMASRQSGLRFSVYLGDLGDAPNERVAELHDQLEGSSEAVLVAVSPGQRVVEVLTGPEARATAARPQRQAGRDEHGGLVQGGRPPGRAALGAADAGRPGGRSAPHPIGTEPHRVRTRIVGQDTLYRRRLASPMSAPVLIVDDHELVGTSLLLSLRGEGLDAHLSCRGDADGVLRLTSRLAPGVVLLDLDLGRDDQGRRLDGARLVGPLTAAGWKVIILSGSSDRARIGAALDGGALAWVPKNAPLPALLAAVRAAQDGRPVMAAEKRDQLIATARRLTAERGALTTKLDRLSQREREVLAMLAQGRRAQAVAEHFVVSLATVRTQIRAVLAKLEVSSQLEAVALYRKATGRNG